MKNLTKILALVLALSMVCVIFAACGKTISGTYQSDARAFGTGAVSTYKFSGNKYELIVETYALNNLTSTTTIEGTYEITETESGELQISFTEKDSESASKPVSFEQGDDYIKIGLVTFTKK